MGLKQAVVLGRSRLSPGYEAQTLERVARELPADYPLWTGLRLFAPVDEVYEIDAVVVGHHALYVLELKQQIPKNGPESILEWLRHLVQHVRNALEQQLHEPPPAVVGLLVVPKEIRDDARWAEVVSVEELPSVILTGHLPKLPSSPNLVPLQENQRRDAARFLDELRHRIRPDRGNVFQELRLLRFELMADMRARADIEIVEQTVALWLIAVVFVRLLEEHGFVERNRLSGPGALATEHAFFETFPLLGPQDYLRFIVQQTPIVSTSIDLESLPSAMGARAIFEFFRGEDAAAPRWNFKERGDQIWDELYTLGETLVKQHALLQTPSFVVDFLLARTVGPAMETFGAENVTMLDPACGSGNFVVAAFEKLCAAGRSPIDALEQVHGVDISPIATTITRMRLLLAYMRHSGTTSIAPVAKLAMHVETRDALVPIDREKQYAVVVCNPPYITEKDPVRRDVYRQLYRSASGNFSLVAPFVERAFQWARPDGYVGLLVSNSFAKRTFGKTLVEEVLPHYELTHIVDSSGVYIPGHGTPTMMLLGRNRRPRNETIRVVAGKKGEPMIPSKLEEGVVWSSIIARIDEPGHEDEYVSIADLSRERMARHPWMFGGQAVDALLERLRQEPQRLSNFATRIGPGSQSGFDAAFLVPAHVARRLSFESDVLRPVLRGTSIRDFGWQTEDVAIAPYGRDDEQLVSVTGHERWFEFLRKYRPVIENQKWMPTPWWRWRRWVESADVAHRIVCPSISRSNQFARVPPGIATTSAVEVIALAPGATEDDALVLLGWLNSSTACFWFRQAGAMQEGALRFLASVLDLMPVPTQLVRPGPIRTKVIALARQLEEENRALAEQSAPVRVLERWDGSSRDGLMDLLGTAQMRDQATRRKIVCRQEDLDWVIYEALGLTTEVVEPIASSASPAERPFMWLTDQWPRGIQRALVKAWENRRKELRTEALLAMLETAEYKRRFTQVDNVVVDDDESLEDIPPSRRRHGETKRDDDFWERTAVACEHWLLDRMEAVFRETPARSLTIDEIITKLEATAAPGIVASVWGSRRIRNTTLVDVVAELLLETSLPARAAQRYTSSGLEKRAAWRASWDTQPRVGAEEESSFQGFAREDYRDAVSYRLRGRWDVPTERFWFYEDESMQKRYGWAGWTDEQKTAVLSGMSEI